MCLLAVRHQPDRDVPLLVAANRDERHARPTDPLRWRDGGIACGLDLEAGGTWLGATRTGRFAALTNIYQTPTGSRSRGALVLGFLQGDAAARDWLAAIDPALYGGFYLVCYDGSELWERDSERAPRPVPPGVHAWTNNRPGQRWAKSDRIEQALAGIDVHDTPALLDLLGTGRGGAETPMEQVPHSLFVNGAVFGTRCSTVVRIGSRVELLERRFDATGAIVGDTRLASDASPEV